MTFPSPNPHRLSSVSPYSIHHWELSVSSSEELFVVSHLNPCCLSMLHFHHHHFLSGLFQDPSNKDPYIPNPLPEIHPLYSYQILTKLCLSSLLASNLSTDVQCLHDKVPVPWWNKALHNYACFFSIFLPLLPPKATFQANWAVYRCESDLYPYLTCFSLMIPN